jgi:hypothetical protein
MSEQSRTFHAELRSVLQGPKAAENWGALRDKLRRYYPPNDEDARGRELLTWGPTYACHDWTEGFELPDPVYNCGEAPA